MNWWQERKDELDAARAQRAHYVYGLRDPRSGMVRYVGCTQDPDTRLRAHISNGKTTGGRTSQRALKSWVRGIVKAGALPEMVVLHEARTMSGGQRAERATIRRMVRQGVPLLNMRLTGKRKARAS